MAGESTLKLVRRPSLRDMSFKNGEDIAPKVRKILHVVPFIILHKVVLAFESVDEILKCDHSNESG